MSFFFTRNSSQFRMAASRRTLIENGRRPYLESSNLFKLKNLFPGCAGSKGSARCSNGFFMIIDGHVSRSQWGFASTQPGATEDPGQTPRSPGKRSSGRSCSEAGPRVSGPEPAAAVEGRGRASPRPEGRSLNASLQERRATAEGRSLDPHPSEPKGRSPGPIPPRGPELEAAAEGQSLGHLFFPEPEGRPRSRGGACDLPRLWKELSPNSGARARYLDPRRGQSRELLLPALYCPGPRA